MMRTQAAGGDGTVSPDSAWGTRGWEVYVDPYPMQLHMVGGRIAAMGPGLASLTEKLR